MSEAESSATTGPWHPRGRLLKVLGVWFGIAAAVGNTIAAGIVRTPGFIAHWLPNPWLFLGVWVAGGAYALVGAPALAELGAAIPRSGGQYNYSRRGIGEYAGFVVGWSDWLSTSGSVAAGALVIGEYSGALIAGLSGHTKSIALCVTLLFGLLQWRGIRWGSGIQLVTGAAKSVAFVVLVLACFLLGGSAHRAAAAAPAPESLAAGWLLVVPFMLALQQVIFTVDGWDGVIYFGEEVKNPGKDIPRAIFGSVLSIMGIYLLLNIAVLYVLPMREVAGSDFALGTASQRVFGRLGDPIFRSIMVISLASGLNACLLMATRVLHAMACDRLFFRTAGAVNRGGTPELSLLLTTAASAAFVIGSFDRVIAMLAFFFVANYSLSFISLFILRRREPGLVRPYRAWGYPWSTGIALAGSVCFLIGAMVTDRKNTPYALGLLVLSYPVFRLQKLAGREKAPREAG